MRNGPQVVMGASRALLCVGPLATGLAAAEAGRCAFCVAIPAGACIPPPPWFGRAAHSRGEWRAQIAPVRVPRMRWSAAAGGVR